MRIELRTKWDILEGVCDPIPVVVILDYEPGAPATGPTYWSGGEPAEGPELQLIEVQPETVEVFSPPCVHAAAQQWGEWFLATDEGLEQAYAEYHGTMSYARAVRRNRGVEI